MEAEVMYHRSKDEIDYLHKFLDDYAQEIETLKRELEQKD